ncbi:MAG: SDR family oxidoreductase [Rhodobacter sp.]|jgi:7-alpha-hydroxysteroid dehydrogenase|nr:SDR family oxidoreductase [Rhodobacter sp.]
MSFSIAGKTAIITGAANGVGLAIARQFASAGANVMLADRDEDRLISEVQTLSDEGANAHCFAGDLREKLTLANLLSATLAEFDRVDILVNASRQVLMSDPLNADDDAFDTLITQNVTPALRLSQLVARRMIKQAEDDNQTEGEIGSIVNLTSIAARRTRPELLSYSVAAAALDQLTRSMAVALAEHRIRVNAVAIGSIMSASLRGALRENGDLRTQIQTITPMGRIGEAVEVAEVVQYLASTGASFVTGQILTVDGGRTLIDPVPSPHH